MVHQSDRNLRGEPHLTTTPSPELQKLVQPVAANGDRPRTKDSLSADETCCTVHENPELLEDTRLVLTLVLVGLALGIFAVWVS